MKNKIEYYYQIININIHEKDNIYYFTYNNKNYMFFICNRDVKELEQIYLLQNTSSKYHKIILNRNRNVVTIINNKTYILVEVIDYNQSILTINDITNKNKISNVRQFNLLLRNDWYSLWTKKIDYIIYQRKHLNKKYLVLDEFLDYFLGLAENAISYVNDTNIKEKKDERDELVISHRRIISNYKSTYYNIADIIIDHPARDITEYLKYVFYNEQIDYNNISKLINSVDLSNYGFRMLFGRMVFPSYFFDMYEHIVNDKLSESQIKTLILKINQYEKYLKFIFNEINKKTKIPMIEWLA